MPMFRIDWTIFSSTQMLDEIAQGAGIATADIPQFVRDAIPRILERVGGLPFARQDIAASEAPEIGARLLRQAVDRTLDEIEPFAPTRSGYLLVEGPVDPSVSSVLPVNKLPLNSASAAMLRTLPGIGQGLAQKIIDERLARGPFKSIADLEDRVSGIGAAIGTAITSAAWIDGPDELLGPGVAIDAGLTDKIACLVGHQAGSDPIARLIASFDLILTQCSARRHPVTTNLLLRDLKERDFPPDLPAANVGVLESTRYYFALPELIAAATSSISICMFHMVLSDENHPTHKLLDALVAALAAGVQIRVLLDQDRASDPYRSTIINSRAKEALDAAGIPCRLDAAERLLHSKFLVIDDNLTIVGSHNWSAGSYFQFDDLSLVIDSVPLAQAYADRFDQLWTAAATQ